MEKLIRISNLFLPLYDEKNNQIVYKEDEVDEDLKKKTTTIKSNQEEKEGKVNEEKKPKPQEEETKQVEEVVVVDQRYQKSTFVASVFGPDYQRDELYLCLSMALFGMTFMSVYTYLRTSYSLSQRLWAIFMAGNIGYAVFVNANCLKKHYHKGQNKIVGYDLMVVFGEVIFQAFGTNYMFFKELHNNWGFAQSFLLFFALSVYMINKAPLHLMRPTSSMMYIFAILLSVYIFPLVKGMEWLQLVLYFKYFTHLTIEVPFRP